MENILLFEIKIPLLNPTLFTIYKITPIPQKFDTGTFSYIKTENEVLAISEQRDQYLFIGDIQLKLDAKMITSNQYIMKENTLAYITHSRPTCETILFTQGKINDKYCTTVQRTKNNRKGALDTTI